MDGNSKRESWFLFLFDIKWTLCEGKPSAHYSYSEQGWVFRFTVGGDNLIPEGTTQDAAKSTAALWIVVTSIILY